jgi:hypothetical protein
MAEAASTDPKGTAPLACGHGHTMTYGDGSYRFVTILVCLECERARNRKRYHANKAKSRA